MPYNPNSKKKRNSSPTLKQRIAMKVLENGGSVGAAMRAAGYTPATAKNPSKLTQSKAFIKILEKAGVTDSALAKAHGDLLHSARIEHKEFYAMDAYRTVKKDKNGKPLKEPATEHYYRHLSDNEIKAQIESVPGHKLLSIHKSASKKIAYYQSPENAVRKSAIEMGYKVKDHFAPEKLDIIEHELTEEESQFLAGLNGE